MLFMSKKSWRLYQGRHILHYMYFLFFLLGDVFNIPILFILQCSYGHCLTTFHPLCGKRASFYMKAMTGGGKPQHKAYCEKHSLEQKEKVRFFFLFSSLMWTYGAFFFILVICFTGGKSAIWNRGAGKTKANTGECDLFFCTLRSMSSIGFYYLRMTVSHVMFLFLCFSLYFNLIDSCREKIWDGSYIS